MIRAVFFDLDNTLYSELDYVHSGFRAAAEFLSDKVNKEAEEIYMVMVDTFREHGRNAVFNRTLEKYNMLSDTLVMTLLYIYRSHRPELYLDSEVPQVIRELHEWRYSVGIITDGVGIVQHNKVAALGLEDMADCIIYTDELGPGRSKPSSAPYKVALDLLGVISGDACYVGDDLSKDFVAPAKLGMRSVHLTKHRAVAFPCGSKVTRGADWSLTPLRGLPQLLLAGDSRSH